jgi:hypothetical protein
VLDQKLLLDALVTAKPDKDQHVMAVATQLLASHATALAQCLQSGRVSIEASVYVFACIVAVAPAYQVALCVRDRYALKLSLVTSAAVGLAKRAALV